MRDDLKPVVLGASVGVIAFMLSVFGDRRFHFSDGCFPKRGLVNGELRDVLDEFSRGIDQIVFVVPPHLRGIELSVSDAPHTHLYISGSQVHETWPPSLYSTAGPILQRLAEGQRVLVLTQSAVFSALLGLLLAEMKHAMASPGQLLFLDLGQVLDIAVPSAGGPWAARLAGGDFGLFNLVE